MRKRITLMAALLIAAMALTACAGSAAASENTAATDETELATEAETTENPAQQTAADTQETVADAQETAVAGADALVVYYSWSGNTQRIAERLAQTVRADTYEIRTVEAYPEDGHETAVVSQEERSSGNLPELVEDLPDLSGYSTIYIGAPIWNAYMPTPVERYLEVTDFTGKTVIPFSTSMGSGRTGFLDDFEARVQNPEAIGAYTDIEFPGNGSPDAYTDEEIDELLHEWLAENGVAS